jgi:hypothetical protein
MEQRFRQALLERTVLCPPKVSPVVRQLMLASAPPFRGGPKLKVAGRGLLGDLHWACRSPSLSRWESSFRCASVSGAISTFGLLLQAA